MTKVTSHHECPGPGCTRSIPNRMLACRTHWYQVSRPTRDRVWRWYYDAPGSDEHMDAIAAAIAEMHP